MKIILNATFLSLLLAISGCTQSSREIKVEQIAKSTMSWDGDKLPAYPEGQPEVTILKVTIPPKASLPTHKHPYINAGVLLKGNLTVFTETDTTLHLKAGDSIVELVNKWHFGKNEGDTPAEILVFYAGIQDSAITVRK